MKKLKSDWQVTVNATRFIFPHAIVCFVGWFIWRYALGFFHHPVVGNIIGIFTALTLFFLMMCFKGTELPLNDLPEEEERSLKENMISGAAFSVSKKMCRVYTQCDLKKAIDYEFISPITGEKYRLIFRKARNERMQTSHLRGDLQAHEETKENLQDKAQIEEEAKGDERIYTQGQTLFREESRMFN